MTLSSIPLFGLTAEVNVTRHSGDTGDGGGGISSDGNETTIYTKRKCRISTLTGEDMQRVQGMDSMDMWKVLFEYSSSLAKSDLIVVPTGSTVAAGNYRVVWIQHKQDHVGLWHHTSVIMEGELA